MEFQKVLEAVLNCRGRSPDCEQHNITSISMHAQETAKTKESVLDQAFMNKHYGPSVHIGLPSNFPMQMHFIVCLPEVH